MFGGGKAAEDSCWCLSARTGMGITCLQSGLRRNVRSGGMTWGEVFAEDWSFSYGNYRNVLEQILNFFC